MSRFDSLVSYWINSGVLRVSRERVAQLCTSAHGYVALQDNVGENHILASTVKIIFFQIC